MKPFITPKVTEAGKKLLEFQLEGGNLQSIGSVMLRHGITAYGMPEGHTFDAAWEFRLDLGEDNFVEFSAACTEVVDWQEVGSLNIRLSLRDEIYVSSGNIILSRVPAYLFVVEKLEKLIYEDDDVISECGLVLCCADGAEIVVAAGISPGSVSVVAPFTTGSFKPQFSLDVCRRESAW